LSLSVTATRDAITQDGKDTSTIQVLVRDEAAKPKAGLELLVGVSPAFGALSTSRIVTGSDGRASATYIAPPPLPPGPSQVTVFVSPIGNNAQAASYGSVDIRLLPVASIPAPAGAPTASFDYSPKTIHAKDNVNFDASSSAAGPGHTIVDYYWDFGDGFTKSRPGPATTHDYLTPGTFVVSLTVTDEIGQTHTVTGLVTVLP
jgi:PKD repeat protein